MEIGDRKGVVMDGDKSEHILEAIPVMAHIAISSASVLCRVAKRDDDYWRKFLISLSNTADVL